MEKKKIKVNYSGSGIKTLSDLGSFLLYVAVIYAAIDIYVFWESGFFDFDHYSIGEIVKALISIIIGFPIVIFAIGVICLVLSALLKLPLYKRALLENKYDFYE